MRLVRWQGDGLGVAIRSERGDGKVVLVPTHVAKRMADSAIRSAGEDPDDYGVRILAPWVMRQWRSYGDGTALIDPNDRMPYLWRAFDEAKASGGLSVLRRSRGTLTLAGAVGSRAVAWLPEEGSEGDLALPLTTGERELVRVAREYSRLIREDGLVDVGTVYKELPGLLAKKAPAQAGHVLVGFDQMGYVQQTLVAGMDSLLGNMTLLVNARECDLLDVDRNLRPDGTWDVHTVTRPDSHGFHVASRVRLMMDGLSALGVSFEEVPACHGSSPDADGNPVSELAHALFMQDASDGIPLRGLVPPHDESVSLLHVAGQTAEDAAIAEMAREKATSGDVAVVGADSYAMWMGLAPRLVAERSDALGRPLPPVRVRATASVPLSSVRALSVLIDASQQIVRLSGMLSDSERQDLGLHGKSATRPTCSGETALRRHSNEPTTAGWFMDMSRDVLGDMSWWPPEAICDLMSEEAFGVPAMVATSMRSRWTRQRTLSAYAVLATLLDEECVGTHMSQLARLVADGSMRDAMSFALHCLRRTGARRADGSAVPVITKTMRAVSISAMEILMSASKSVGNPDPGDPGSVERYFMCVSQILAHSRVNGTIEATPPDATDGGDGDGSPSDLPTVSLLSLDDVDGIAPGSYETVIMVGQDSVTSAIGRDDSLQNVLMAKLGCAETAENMATYRAKFLTAVALARSSVVFERTLRKTEGKHVSDTFPSVGLSNAMLAYAPGTEGDVLVRDFSEVPFARNFSLDGEAPSPAGEMAVSPVERCSDGLLDLMWASRPRGGEGSRQVMLSASDVDTYARCGHRWFVERILGVRAPEEGIPPYAFGSFAHSVMEGVHRDLIRRAAKAVVADDGGRYPVTDYAKAMAEGDRLDGRVSKALPGDVPGDEPGEEAIVATSGPIPRGYAQGMPGTRIGGNGQVSPDDATKEFRRRIREAYARELSRSGDSDGRMIPHTITDATKADMMAQSVERFAAYEAQMFWKNRPGKGPSYFVPRFVELPFGEEYGRPVTIAGVPFHGTIDRIDVNSQGECIIIDYKHATPEGFGAKHCLSPYEDSNLQLIVYAMAVRQILPDLRIAGLAYIGTRYPYAVAGKLDDEVFDATDAKGINLSADSRLTPADERDRRRLPPDAPTTMEAFIDAMAGQVEAHVESMAQGIHLSPSPDDRDHDGMCPFCPAHSLCNHTR